MDLGLAGRVAVVTAGSRGLGRASALALAAEGCDLVLSSRGGPALEATAADAAALGVAVEAVAADVTDPGTPARLVARALERFGRLDVAVANAGGPPAGRALEVDDDAILSAVGLNLLPSVRLVRAAAGPMTVAGWGRMVLITSATVKQPSPTLALSNTARAGLWGWAKTAAQDLFPSGVTLNLACPGLHRTDRILELYGAEGNAAPMGDPADFGAAVTFLCSRQAAFVTATTLVVDGGATLGL
jgi:3-oxoacyl-[acyl-carrier protein] reductase